MRLLFLLMILLLTVSTPAIADVLPAKLASSEFPVPTFNELHEQYARVCAHEGGMLSVADQDGILRSLLYRGGGRRAGRNRRGQGYGLDYALLMRRMLRHSKRTFPSDSRFLAVSVAQKQLIENSRTRLNRWASTLRTDCSKPSGWPEYKLDGVTPMTPWRAYEDRCKRFMRSTRKMLKGRIKSYCTGQPTTWGSVPDIRKRGGALDKGWAEIYCDRPPTTHVECDVLRYGGRETRAALWNSRTCARNTFWSWRKNKEDRSDKRRRQGGQSDRPG